MGEIILAYTHILGIFIVVISLFVENMVITKEMTIKELKRLTKADSWYGLGAIVMLITGFARIYLVGKGSDYYWSHPLFLIKLGIFTVSGLLSIYPTIQFIKLSKKLKVEGATEFTWGESSKFKLIALLQLGLILTLPFLANMIARGIGYS
jgi:putative membrane protein